MTLELRPYQKEDVAFLSSKNAAGCFNQQRTGKTPTILSVLKTKGTEKNLIVCPASLLYQWKEEYEAWLDQPCLVITGTIAQKEKILEHWYFGAVISYGSLKTTKKSDGMIDKLLKYPPDAVILDEAHRIKNPKSANFKSIKRLTKIPVRYALTGTPAPNKAEEVWSILHFINPKTWSSYWKFAEEYFYVQRVPYGHQHLEIGGYRPGKQKELQEYLNDIATNRKRKEVMTWLPEKDYMRIKLPLTTKQNQYLSDLANFFETENIVTQGILDRLIRYRQICLDPALLNLQGKSPKTEWILNYLSDYPDKPVIIFSKFTSYLNRLTVELSNNKITFRKIIGETQISKRQEFVKSFQKGEVNVLLINIDAGKEGLTLDRAETTIFTDKYPPIGDIEQAEDRFIATSEDKADKPHTIIELCMKKTYDEQLYDLLEKRKSETDVINDFKSYLKGGKHGTKN